MADQIANHRVARSQRGRGDFPAPGERGAGRVRRRRHEGPASDRPANQAAQRELAIGGYGSCPADAERLRQLALGRQAQTGGEYAFGNAALEGAHDMTVDRSRPRELASESKLPE